MATAHPTIKTPSPSIYCANEKPFDMSLRAIESHKAGIRLPAIVNEPRKTSI